FQGARGNDVAIHNHPSGLPEPSDADIGVASTLGNSGVAFYIVSNDVERCAVVVPLFEKREREPVDEREIAELLGPDGAIARALGKLRAVVVKGRSNYVSLRRAEEAARAEPALFDDDDERAEVQRLAEWARATRTGDRQELVPPPTPGAWERVESQTDNCLR